MCLCLSLCVNESSGDRRVRLSGRRLGAVLFFFVDDDAFSCHFRSQMGRQLGKLDSSVPTTTTFSGRKEKKRGDGRWKKQDCWLPAGQERVCTAGLPNSSGPMFSWDTSISLPSCVHFVFLFHLEETHLSHSLSFRPRFLSFSLYSDDIHLFLPCPKGKKRRRKKHFLLFRLFFYFLLRVLGRLLLLLLLRQHPCNPKSWSIRREKSPVSPSSFLSVRLSLSLM